MWINPNTQASTTEIIMSNVTALIFDFSSVIVLIIGILMGFFIIRTMIGIFRRTPEERDRGDINIFGDPRP